MSDKKPSQAQRMESVKALLMQQMNGVYGQVVNFVNQLPIDAKLKEFAIMNLDQGIMWVEQGVRKLQFEVTDEGGVQPKAAEETTPAPEVEAPAAPVEPEQAPTPCEGEAPSAEPSTNPEGA